MDKLLLVTPDRSLGRAEFDNRCSRAATALKSLGIARDSRIAILMYNDTPFLEVSVAASRLGAYTVPINWHLTSSEIDYILRDSGASILVAHDVLWHNVAPGLTSEVKTLLVEAPPGVLKAYGSRGESSDSTNYLSYEAELESSEPYLSKESITLGSILYTSGTTGYPKGVRRQPVDPKDAPQLGGVLQQFFGFSAEREVRTIIPAPLYHAAPNMYAIVAANLGHQVVLMTRFDPEQFLREVDQHKITHISLVPTMLHRLLRLPKEVRQAYDTSSIEFVATSAAPCPAFLKTEITKWWGPVLYEFYGGTETGGVTFCTPEDALRRPGTVGKVHTSASVKIRRENSDCEAGPGETGEIYCRLHCFPDFTYLNNDDKRKDIEWNGLISLGDIGYLDEEQYLYICDRQKDMVISGGVNIYPAEIEKALLNCAGVADCAVFGIPDTEFGESVCAHIVAEDGHELTESEVKRSLDGKIARFKIPRVIEFVESLPREESGKLFKRKLKERYLSKTPYS